MKMADVPAAKRVPAQPAAIINGVRKMPPPVPVSPASSPMTAPLTTPRTTGKRGGNSSPARAAVTPKRKAAKMRVAPTRGR